MRRRLVWSGVLSFAACCAAGCSGEGNPGVIPESKDPQATRAFIENTAGIKQRPQKKQGKAAELPPQPPK